MSEEDLSARREFLQRLGAAALLLPLAGFRAGEQSATLKAPRLRSGDTIALTAPAGAIFNQETIKKASDAFEGAGFKVMLGETLQAQYGYLAGTDTLRANELNRLFRDPNVKAIVAMRGGWGCARLLHLLDFGALREHPKVICGFSDITTLLIAVQQQTGLITFHGPVGNSSLGEFTMEHFLRLVKKGEAFTLQQPANDPVTTITPGKARGELFGGNLTVLSTLIGSGFLPEWQGKILLLEETEEEPYSIDRMLTQLKLAGVLGKISALVFGKCTKCEAEEPDRSLTLQQVFDDHIKPLGIPAFYGSSFGHVKDKFTLPIGAAAEVDATTGSITLLGSCVK